MKAPKIVWLGLAAFTVAACQIEDTGTQSTAAKAENTTSALCTVQMIQAVDVLIERGFSTPAIASFMIGGSESNECPTETWLNHLDAQRGLGDYGGMVHQDIIYNHDTGDLFDWDNPVQVAQTVPSCLAGTRPDKECKPTYHPRFSDPKLQAEIYETVTPVCYRDEFGEVCDYPAAERACVLTPKWKKACAGPIAGAICWSFEKADFVTAPPSKAIKDRIDLMHAKRKAQVKTARASAPAKPVGNPCSEENVTFE